MDSGSVLSRWLHDQRYKPPAAPDSLADEFPLATLPSPPSSSSLSDIASVDGRLHPHTTDRTSAADVAGLVHPPTPRMEDFPAAGHARRRSSSLAGPVGAAAKSSTTHRRHHSEHIPEEAEGGEGSDDESSEKTDSLDLDSDDTRSSDGMEDDEETGLTGKDRRRRRRRKRRATLLDQRVAPDVHYTKEEEKLANESLMKSIAINTLLICLWYLFSISISVYNKWMFKLDKGDGETENIFPFPLFTTCLHMIVQFSLASLVLFLIPAFRPRHDSLNPHASRSEPVDPKKPLMSKWFYLTRIGPCGIATGMDIGLGNMSLKFISLTFFTMCKSSALGFVLVFAFLFRLEQPSWRLVFIILIMTVGVVMMVAGETAFDVRGFLLVMTSACSSGFRWSLTQILLLRNPATANPFSSIFFLAPVMFLSLVVLAVPIEGLSAIRAGLAALVAANGVPLSIGILVFPGTLAFLMTSSEFALLKRTSVVTLSICGIFKEVVTITTANLVFDDPLTPINLTGLLITIGSIAAYNYIKIRKMREEARVEAHIAVVHRHEHEHEHEREGGYAAVPVAGRETDVGRAGPVAGGTGGGAAMFVRNSLSLAPGVGGGSPATESPVRTGPVKRPEDLE